MKARIISGAGKAFIKKKIKPGSSMTAEQRDYIDDIISLENVVLNVRYTYGKGTKRIVLEYPVYKTTKDGKGVVGVDVEAEYVEIVEQ